MRQRRTRERIARRSAAPRSIVTPDEDDEDDETSVMPITSRSALTNGRRLSADVDGRSAWARRFRDVLEGLFADLGGEDRATETQRTLIRRIATLVVESEIMESKMAAAGTGAGQKRLATYARCAGTMKRLLEHLDIERQAKDITPRDQTAAVIQHIRSVVAGP
jgi:hypothetical protein